MPEAEQIFANDSQFGNRVPKRFLLKPFSATGNSFIEFQKFLSLWSEVLENLMGNEHFLENDGIAHRILRASQGLPGNVWALLMEACRIAARDNRRELTMRDFAKAIDKELANLQRADGNPFEISNEQVLKMPVTPPCSVRPLCMKNADSALRSFK
jgi:hypothetical protein